MVPHCSCQKFIPYKHRFINNLPSILGSYVLLKTAHDVVGVAEEEVLGEIDRVEESFISTKVVPQIHEYVQTIIKSKEH
jgi:hypothetical protein